MKVDESPPVGLYEKALPAELSWEERLKAAAEAGYDYVEISIDESNSRLARLDWSVSKREKLLKDIDNTNMPILTMCLSAHRKYPLGSSNPKIRSRGLKILKKSIEFAVSFRLKIIQINGYDAYYEPSNAETQARFISGLKQGVEWASHAGIMLGLENVDTPFVDSIEKALRIVNEINSPWFQLYSDIGNLLAAGYHPPDQIKLAGGHLVGLHVKDALPGCVRRVAFEEGDVPFGETFNALSDISYRGPLTVEMWAELDQDINAYEAVKDARIFVDQLIALIS